MAIQENQAIVKPKRPKTSYMIFCDEKRAHVKALHPGLKKPTELAPIFAAMWHALSDEQKAFFKAPKDCDSANSETAKAADAKADTKEASKASKASKATANEVTAEEADAEAKAKAEAKAAKAPPVETVVKAMLLVLRSTFDPRNCECLKEPPELMSALDEAARQVFKTLHERGGGWNPKQSRAVSLLCLKIAALDQKGLRSKYQASFDQCTGEDYKFALGVWTRRYHGAPPGTERKKYPNRAELDEFLRRFETAPSVPTASSVTTPP